jgi:peptide/nickel transport system substrate-binding protein
MSNRLCFAALAAAFALAFAAPAALAATPKDSVVMAWQLDGIITFDLGESYEIATQ